MSVTPDTDAPVEHRQTIATRMVQHDDNPAWTVPEYGRRCACGHRGVWLRNLKKVAPCPRAEEVR